jgi:hypothetical protein
LHFVNLGSSPYISMNYHTYYISVFIKTCSNYFCSFITHVPLGDNGSHTILSEVKEQEYYSYEPRDLREKYGVSYYNIMNELYATQKHKIINNIMIEKYVSNRLDGLIETLDINRTQRVISIKQLLLLRYICTLWNIKRISNFIW